MWLQLCEQFLPPTVIEISFKKGCLPLVVVLIGLHEQTRHNARIAKPNIENVELFHQLKKIVPRQ